MMKRIIRSLCILIGIITIVSCLSSCCCPILDPNLFEDIEDSYGSYSWYDADGTLLHTKDDGYHAATEYPLPEDTEKWDYVQWNQGGNPNEYIAYRQPRSSYFAGNVFQIVVMDLAEQPVATGSAFVFTRDGWFITNAHVMEGAYYAQAIFNIPNKNTGESFTYLNINQGSYCHLEKDLYIGKIENYSSIQPYYRDISVNTKYSIGQTTYSIGYPNSSTDLIIKEGRVTEQWGDLYEKLYSGNTYICSSSEIAPGSSGGVLVNDNLEVIGITTLGWFGDDMRFISGAAISAFNFVNLIQGVSDGDLISVQDRFHKDETVFINYFNAAKDAYANGKADIYQFEDGTLAYIYKWSDEDVNDEGYAFQSSEQIVIAADGWISYNSDYYWDTETRRTTALHGYYNAQTGLEDFTYEFKYEWGDGSYFALESEDINYSTNISLTLKDYTTDSLRHSVDKEEITYAKEQFNACYETLTKHIEKYQ